MSRWISWVRPRGLPPSRGVRVVVERGSIEYSAVTHPWPDPLRKRGTPFSTEAAHSTRVSPVSMITEPSAKAWAPVWMVVSRSWSGLRPSERDSGLLLV